MSQIVHYQRDVIYVGSSDVARLGATITDVERMKKACIFSIDSVLIHAIAWQA